MTIGDAGLDVVVGAAGAEEVGVENLIGREADRLRALNRVLGEELQPEELLLEAVEAPWKEESDGESSDGEVEMGSPLHPGWLITTPLK